MRYLGLRLISTRYDNCCIHYSSSKMSLEKSTGYRGERVTRIAANMAETPKGDFYVLVPAAHIYYIAVYNN